jgi:hypothetical protein
MIKYFIIFLFISQLCYSYTFNKVSSPQQACEYANTLIQWEYRDPKPWYSVDYIMLHKHGLCRDIAEVMMEILHQSGYSPLYYSVYVKGTLHALVYCNHNYYDPTSGRIDNTKYKINFFYTYNEMQYYINKDNK